MALTYLHYNYGRTTAGGAHPDWRRDPQAGGGDGLSAGGVSGIVHFKGWVHARDFEGWRARDFMLAESGKSLRRVVQVPVGVVDTTYLVVYIEAGAYFIKWTGANVLRGRFGLLGPGYETGISRANPLPIDVTGSYFASGVNTKFSGDEGGGTGPNNVDPNKGTGFTVGDIPGGTDNILVDFTMIQNEVRRVWVPYTDKVTKIGLATTGAAGDLLIENAA